MPYRRLPNTDAGRLKALKDAFDNTVKNNNKHPFSSNVIYELGLIISEFEQAVTEYKESFNYQKKNKKNHLKLTKTVKLYISHFIQVMNFAIERDEFTNKIRKYYNLPTNSNKLPTLQTEKHLEKWGKILIEGEQQRLLEGGKPIQNPTLASLKTAYEKFVDSYYLQKNLQKRTSVNQKRLVSVRPKVDIFIKQLWDDIEANFDKYPPIIKREKSKLYGVKYIYRKSEEKIELDDILNFGLS